jgi:tetraacyldisaccharide 4'-kinase
MTGRFASLSRAALLPLAGLYRVGLAARTLGLRLCGGPWKASCPVVSVGNLTVGGTGKTPMTAWLADATVELGGMPLIVSRGYASPSGEANDEALELTRFAPDVPHVQQPDRRAAIERARREHDFDVVILDDGFQHRRVARDLDLVLIDALYPFGFGHVLPRGLLREPPSALSRATHVVITRADLVDDEALEALRRRIASHAARGGSEAPPILTAAHRPTRLLVDRGPPREPAVLRGMPVVAACGIGNPEAFRRTLEGLGARLLRWTTFPDHHDYKAEEIGSLLAEAKAVDAEMLVTTVKDHVKWRALREEGGVKSGVPVAALEVRLRMLEGEQTLRQDLACLLELRPGGTSTHTTA